jgi:glycosyltransferase involved in cell wall biosynthesis
MPHTWRRLSQAWSVAHERRRLAVSFDIAEFPEWNAEGWVETRRGELPVVVRLHSSAAQIYAHRDHLNSDRRLAIRLEDDAVRRADLVTGTAAQRLEVSQRLGLASDGVSEITYPVLPTTPVPLPTAPAICFAGRFEQRKGPETLVRAMPAVRRTIRNARLVLVGKDTSDEHHNSFAGWLKALASELDVGDAVEIVEQWGTEAVARHLAASTVCAVPSLWESFGYVAAEAAGMGRPVVASDIAALGEIVIDGETGRLVPPGAEDRWADALIEILSDHSKATSMGRAGAEHIGRLCDPDRIATITLDAYEHAIRRHRAKRHPAKAGVSHP